MSAAFTAAARGAAFLDEKLGLDWWECIDLDRLDLGSRRRCVLGQWAEANLEYEHLTADYDEGATYLGLDYRSSKPVWLGLDSYGPSFEALTKAWREIILFKEHEAEGS